MEPAVRIGLGYVIGVKEKEMEALVEERERSGPYAGVADLASRSGASHDGLERLAWAGALDSLASSREGRREAFWRLGVAGGSRRMEEGTQLALPLEPPGAPKLAPLQPWETMLADYSSTGMTLGEHPMALLRDELGPEVTLSSELERTPDGEAVEIAGMVVARQRPETAKGIVFMLVEDERGSVNLIVPRPAFERFRAVVRTAPLVRARGRLERREGTINVLVAEIAALEQPDLRAVAPAGHAFGRRG